MNAVPNPVGIVRSGMLVAEVAEECVERYERGMIVLCEATHDGGHIVHQLLALVEVLGLGHPSGTGNERSAKHELHTRKGVSCLIKQCAILGFPRLDAEGKRGILLLSVEEGAGIVDADEDADYIGMQVDGILLPAGSELFECITADATVPALDFGFGILAFEIAGALLDVAMSIDVVLVPLIAFTRWSHIAAATSPSAIGDGVANPEHATLGQQGAQPLAKFADVLRFVAEVVAPAPAVTTYGIKVHGDAYTMGYKGVVIFDAVANGHEAIVAACEDEGWWCVLGYLQFVAVLLDEFLRRFVTQQEMA